MNSNDIIDEAIQSLIGAINSIHLIKVLELSNNRLSSASIIQLINTLSKSKTMKLLDIRKNN